MINQKGLPNSIGPNSPQARKKARNEPCHLGCALLEKPSPCDAYGNHNVSLKRTVVLQKPYDLFAERFIFFEVEVLVSYVDAIRHAVHPFKMKMPSHTPPRLLGIVGLVFQLLDLYECKAKEASP